MKTIIIHKTKKTPEVVINYSTNTFSIEGHSVSEDAAYFYGHVSDEFKKYKKIRSEVLFVINLQSLNSVSIKSLLGLFKEASSYDDFFQKTEIDWLFPKDDTVLKESGQLFEKICRLKFNYKEY
ncbi:hypothetical protein CNR22_04895 [Sphingobacteriaceae bacterium]|nr:hypothetical protein CNR22_04895 [Sphingobacteriaceae bacterium]